MLKDKMVVICLPGNTYSGNFMKSLLSLCFYISGQGGEFAISQDYSSMVNFARCKVAGADVTRGENQKPFNGQHYDYMMWIDSDIAFNVEMFQKLLEMDKDVASGWYSQPGGTTPVVETMNDAFFKANGSYEFITTEKMMQREHIFKADYIGFGWVLIKQGVFEQLKYPWFAPKLRDLGNGIKDMCSEDVAWCADAREAGIDIWVDPEVRVGHEKVIAI